MNRTRQSLFTVFTALVAVSMLIPATTVRARSAWGGGNQGKHGGRGGYGGSYYKNCGNGNGSYWNDWYWWGLAVPLTATLTYSALNRPRYERTRVTRRVIRQTPAQPSAQVYQPEPPRISPEELMLEHARRRQAREALASTSRPPSSAQPDRNEPFGVGDVLQLSQAGLSDEVIISQVQQSGTLFRLSTDVVIDLKQSGVSDAVIDAMINSTPPSAAPPGQ